MASTPRAPAEALTDPTQRRFRGSAKISEYEVMKEKLGEGTFGVVSKARSKRNGNIYALKKILMHNEKEGFPITALREVKLLKSLSHPNILHLAEMIVERHQVDDKSKTGKKRATMYTVTPYMDHDLSGMLNNSDIQITVPMIKCYMMQLLEGTRYLHDVHILHRDMKAANILISNKGILQIADFGLARVYDGMVPQPGRGNGEAVRDYTSLVVTRWYRPPELLLTLKRYTPAIDLWGVGCVFAEMYEHKPILEGRSDVDQCVRIFQLLGSPNEDNMPGWFDLPGCEGKKEWDRHAGNVDQRFRSMGTQGLDLLKKLLCLDWRKRINAIDALQHDFFKTDPLPVKPSDIPRYEDSHELDNRLRGNQAKERNLPPAPAGGTVGMGPDEQWANGSYQNGYGYGDRDRGPRGYPRDRGPPGAYGGPPSRGYDDRKEPRGPPVTGRQPAWREPDRSGLRPPSNGHQLPPRPEGLPVRPENVRPPPPPAAAPTAGPPVPSRGGAVDTYIPSYNGGPDYDRRPPPPSSRDYDRGPRRNSRDDTYTPPRYRDADMPTRQYRDVDAPGGRPGGRVDSYRERDHYRRDEPRRDEPRRTRSRSPEREKRERLQNRERDFYRR